MFTGIVHHIGRVHAIRLAGKDAAVRLSSEFRDYVLGESIAVNGTCLTVAEIHNDGFTAHASTETLQKTTLGELKAGSRVHLERALKVGDAIGGHIVSGHVDGVGKVVSHEALGESLKVTFEAPSVLAPLIAPKGSIAIDGTSLTVNHASGVHFDVVLVPFTRSHTLLDARTPGSRVNLEVDVLAKHVARLLGKPGVDGADPANPDAASTTDGGGVTLDLLSRQGYL